MARVGIGSALGVGKVLLGVVVVVYALTVFALGEAPGWTKTSRVCSQAEPGSGGSSYGVFIREPSFSLSLDDGPTEAWVGRSADYGTVIELNPSTEPREVTCDWTPDGVDVVEPNGIVHHVPSTVYEGGR